jgi:hypothetical protein
MRTKRPILQADQGHGQTACQRFGVSWESRTPKPEVNVSIQSQMELGRQGLEVGFKLRLFFNGTVLSYP